MEIQQPRNLKRNIHPEQYEGQRWEAGVKRAGGKAVTGGAGSATFVCR